MTTEPDIRWKQRLNNFREAHRQLASAVEESNRRELSELEKQGLIQAFEFTHELAWNVMRDYFRYQGNSQINGSRDATREAFQNGLISQGDIWMEMIKSRNQTSHTYNKGIANDIVQKIRTAYFAQISNFLENMSRLGRPMNEGENGLSVQTLSKLRSVFERSPAIERVLLYGSRALGKFREGSDIDLCLVGESLTVEDLLRIEIELDELLLPYKVDLSIFSKLEDPGIVDHIVRVAIEVYRQ